jgi:TfoX/Sxy family transcriptional regulator of competence genes
MSTTKNFMEYVVDQLDSSPLVHTRAMFGEYALYYDETVVALICDNTVFLKINSGTEEILGDGYTKGLAYPTSKDFYVLDEDILEDKELFMKLMKSCAEEVKKSSKHKKK